MTANLFYIIISLLAVGLSPATGFEIIFYLGSQCRGQRMGGGIYHYPGWPNICHPIPVNAASATVKADGDADVYNVAFWRGGCGKELRGSGDGGECINFSGATEFSVADDGLVPGGKRRAAAPAAAGVAIRGAAALAAVQEQYRNDLNVTAEEAEGSLSPYFDPSGPAKAGFGHGNVTIDDFGNKVRWHQVALGISVAVPFDEWDDKVHVPSDQFIPYGNAYGRETTILAQRDELTRRWNYAQCRALLTCAREVAGGAALNFRQGVGQLVECADRLKAYGRTLYDHLSWEKVACWVTSHFTHGVAGAGMGILMAGGGASKDDNDRLERCTARHSQASAFIEAIVDVANAGNENAGRVDITLDNGNILVIYAKVFPVDKVPPPNACWKERARRLGR